MDLTTTYLGLELKNPIVASSSPLSYTLDGIRKLEDCGASAVVLFSLFEEQIAHGTMGLDRYLNLRGDAPEDSVEMFPEDVEYNADPEAYLELIRSAKEKVSIPIIGSLNGVSSGEWLAYALHMQHAGADGIELNLYYVPTDIELTSLSTEWMYMDAVSDVAAMIQIPLSVKMSPYFSSIPYMANNLQTCGADGLVLFNRFYQPELDIDGLEIKPAVQLSRSEDLTLPLRWVALMYGRVPVDFAVTGGVHTCRDVIKSIMSGASVVTMAAELLVRGPARIGELIEEITAWMETQEYDSIKKMRGFMSERFAITPEAFERASYTRALVEYGARYGGRK